MHTYRHGGEPGSAGLRAGLLSNTPPQLKLGAQRTFRLDVNSVKTDVGRPLVKILAYWDEVGMCSTLASPRQLFSNEVQVNLDMLGALVLDMVGGVVDNTDVVTRGEARIFCRWGRDKPIILTLSCNNTVPYIILKNIT